MDDNTIMVEHDDSINNTIKAKKKTRKKRKKINQENYVPSVQRAWKVGYFAAQANLPECRNPFVDTTNEYSAWLEGWWSGFYDEPLHQGMSATK